MGNRTLDNILKQVYIEGQLNRSVKSIAAQLIYFTNLVDSKSNNLSTREDIQIV